MPAGSTISELMDDAVNRWTWSDKLAVALACLAAIVALVLFWIEKTPLTAGVTLAAMFCLSIYPVLHFVRSGVARGIALLAVVWLVGVFGWAVWPHKSATVTKSSPAAVPSLDQPTQPVHSEPHRSPSVARRHRSTTETRQKVTQNGNGNQSNPVIVNGNQTTTGDGSPIVNGSNNTVTAPHEM